ncbi:MAG: hypothetical protein JWP12_3543 [Bacteroidetes bacterium]|nr:hypothetical protein [Bacteroidota bacterium]
MKKLFGILALSMMMHYATAQDTVILAPANAEVHGKTLNLSVGTGFYGYVGHPLVQGTINYEFGIARNFTLAPTVGMFTYSDGNYWGDDSHVNRYYTYRETYIPMGLKLSYYFDELFGAGPKWDFYIGTSAGYVYRNTHWESGYQGDTTVKNKVDSYYIGMHLGAEYHLNNTTGIFADLSNTVSTIGLGIHF